MQLTIKDLLSILKVQKTQSLPVLVSVGGKKYALESVDLSIDTNNNFIVTIKN